MRILIIRNKSSHVENAPLFFIIFNYYKKIGFFMEKKFNTCQHGLLHIENDYTKEIKAIVNNILKSCDNDSITTHIDEPAIPNLNEIIQILIKIEDLLFPGYFGNQELRGELLEYHIGSEVNEIFDDFSAQISNSLRNQCQSTNSVCIDCLADGQKKAIELLKKVPSIRKMLKKDVIAAMKGDPAAANYDEIVFSYPGVKAITLHRVAHELYKLEVPIIPRMINEYAHKSTGIDIHPGATIGESFFIDHGTGVVIGETTTIGDNVKIYQGVTLGALSFELDKNGNLIRDIKRHPTIENDVTIYAGATILGGKTIIGKGSIVGGNVFLIDSVKPGTKVVNKQPEVNKEIKLKENK